MTYWKCSAGLPPSEPREVKLSCASDPQKAVWLSLDLSYAVETYTHLFSVHGFHLTKAIQLFPTQTSKPSCEFRFACCGVSEG